MITILTVDKPTVNNRIYPREGVEKAIKEYTKKYVDHNHAMVYYGLGDNHVEPSLSNVCGLVESIILDGDEVKIELRYLDTLAGKVVKELHKDDITWTPVGIGKLKVDIREGGGYIIEDYELNHIAVIPKEKFPL